MKSVRFSLINKKFDDQYTFDLQGYLSVQDFCSSFKLLNQSVFKNPPPGNKLVWVIAVWVFWMIGITLNYLLWIFTKSSHGLVILPFFMILTTLLFIWRHRVLRQRFELSILSICNRINATENIRGINYRFSKNGSDLSDLSKQVTMVSNSNLKTVYSILIEFDDRYNALSSQQFNRYPSVDFVTVPLYAHVSEKASTAWTSTKQYDEKFITHQ
ncbi:hypothetical protein BDF21DRAFT_373834 [Thamnidium elegans]|uniref:Uncharacterized protein n=1 Tax=Thamnidium elegans TaxID=101142 RepID=A0A8H7VWP9_9FUNG|nr:hypothetical protein INT48_006002 [Thamnidium elegans]KAI8095591.1 hypothetical protein BDF21DRAFT_373834 [Thamnidium elegans]